MTLRTLYRPVGLKELQLILDADLKKFPPRLDWQPIFYPVLNKEYAIQIARDWNTKDAASSYAGFVTEFDVASSYLTQFDEQVVGTSNHRELWVPAEKLEDFNAHIQGLIRVTNAFYGEQFKADAAIQKRIDAILNGEYNSLSGQ